MRPLRHISLTLIVILTFLPGCPGGSSSSIEGERITLEAPSAKPVAPEIPFVEEEPDIPAPVVVAPKTPIEVIPDPVTTSPKPEIEQLGFERVARVVDGDTIYLTNGLKVRYIGMDTPERNAPFYEEAREYNKKLVEGVPIRLEMDETREDRYGRRLAYVYLKDGTFVNLAMVKAGLARPMTFKPNTRYLKRFVRADIAAQKAGVGLWKQYANADQIAAKDCASAIGGFRRVRFKVTYVDMKNRRFVFLRSGKGKKTFTATISKFNLPHFKAAGKGNLIGTYKGKTIEVWGKVTEFKGNGKPEIHVRSSAQIIVLD